MTGTKTAPATLLAIVALHGMARAAGNWQALPTEGAPSPRDDASLLWRRFLPLTDDTLLSWGPEGLGPGGARIPHAEGLIYDVRDRRFRPVARVGAPSPRLDADVEVLEPGTAVVFGGEGFLLDGALYRAQSDAWEDIGAPPGWEVSIRPTGVVWTGRGFALWGGGLHRTAMSRGFQGRSNEGLWLDL
jgi:hypothetical protein